MKVEELMWVINNNYQKVQRQELVWKIIFVVYFATQIAFDMFMLISNLLCSNMKNLPEMQNIIDLAGNSVNLVIKTIVFIVLLCHLFKYGNYVFKKIRKKMIVYFMLDFVGFVLILLC